MAERAKADRDQRSTAKSEDVSLPTAGETYHCDICGMALEITSDCKCEDPAGPHLECCGQELSRA